MPSIYDVTNWSSSTVYKKNDIVLYQNKFFYNLNDGNLNTTPAVNSIYWGGVISHGGANNPQFIWTPSYNLTASVEPKVKSIRFGDGYEQRFADGVSNSLINLDLTFDKREAQETAAILHFFQQRKGFESFFFTPPEPYSTRKKFVCRRWDSSLIFHNNYSIRANFEEVSQ